MKKIILFLLLPILSVFAYGPGNFGVPPYLWQATYALNNTPGLPVIPLNIYDEGKFVEQIQARMAISYPSVSLSHSVDLQDAGATTTALNSGNTDGSEMFYFAGHGNNGTTNYYDAYVNLSYRPLGGWTRWAFYVACLTLYNTSVNSNYTNALSNGLHAIFGYQSNYTWYTISYDCNWFGQNCSYYRSSDKWAKFATKWVTNGEYMADSWFEAVKETSYDQAGYGVAPAVLYSYGYVNGVYYIGANEKVTTMYNGNVSSNLSKAYTYSVYGTPTYF